VSRRRVRELYRAFAPFLRPYALRLLLAYGALGGTVLMMLLRPWPLKLVLDAVILRRTTLSEAVPLLPAAVDDLDRGVLLAALCGSLVLVSLLEAVFGFLQKVWFAAAGQGAATDALEHAFSHLAILPRSVTSPRSGDVVVRLTSDVKALRDLLVNHVQRLGGYSLKLASAVAVMAWMDWRLTLLALLVVPFVYYASYRFARGIRRAVRRKRTKEGVVASMVQETLSTLKVVQAFAQEEAERERFRREARESLDAGLESARLGGAFSRAIRLLPRSPCGTGRGGCWRAA
jgi:ABC-type multidrug transport system fused ATPase/permease subunit